jgi:hypothetical protein
MPATSATIGYGTLLKRGDGGSPEVFTAIAEVTSITPPQAAADDVEVTHLTSPNRTKEFIQGMIDAGEASIHINWIPNDATHDELTGLLANQIAGTVKNWQIVLPSGVLIWQFPGYVKTFEPDEITAGDALGANVTFKVTGASTYS